MKSISIDGAKLIGTGGTGEVYALDSETVMKLYYGSQSIEQIEKEKALSRTALVLGVPTAISFHIVECDGRIGVVYEMLGAQTLSEVMIGSGDDLDRWIREYAQLALQIHSIEAAEAGIPSVKEQYFHLIEASTEWLSPKETEDCRRLVSAVPECTRLLHGNLHTKNVMLVNHELITIDVADMSYGHPVFDLAANYLNFQISSPAIQAHVIGLSNGLPQIVWDGFLREYFGSPDFWGENRISDERLLAARIQDIVPFALLKMALAPAIAPDSISEESLGRIMDVMRTRFLPHIGSMIDGLALEGW